MRFIIILIFILCFNPNALAATETLSLENAIDIAIRANPEISAMKERVEAEHSRSIYEGWISNPRIGWMKEVSVNFMTQLRGPMNFWTVAQDVEFPLKVIHRGSAQKQKALAFEEELFTTKWNIRQKAVSAYYNLYSSEKVLSLLNLQKEIIRDMSRIVEARRAVGEAPQQDEMKVHVEQTLLENEIIIAEQDREAAYARLNAVLNREADYKYTVPAMKTLKPTISKDISSLNLKSLLQTPEVKHSKFLLEEANENTLKAKWGIFPTTYFAFRKPYTNDDPGAYVINLEFSIPLWFTMKDIPEITTAQKLAIEADANLTRTYRSIQSDFIYLATKVRSTDKLLTIYETALIPQTETTFKSSRAAYQAGEVNFIELLESERSYYAAQITFYKLLVEYTEKLTELEKLLGTSVSTIPTGGIS